MTDLDAMRQALKALDAVNEFDYKCMLPIPLWRDVMAARGVLAMAIGRAEKEKVTA